MPNPVEPIYAVSIANITEETRKARQKMVDVVTEVDYLNKLGQPVKSCFQIQVRVTENVTERVDDWIICNNMGSGGAQKMALEESLLAQGLKLIPWGGVSSLIPGKSKSAKGRIFCFLPLPTETQVRNLDCKK